MGENHVMKTKKKMWHHIQMNTGHTNSLPYPLLTCTWLAPNISGYESSWKTGISLFNSISGFSHWFNICFCFLFTQSLLSLPCNELHRLNSWTLATLKYIMIISGTATPSQSLMRRLWEFTPALFSKTHWAHLNLFVTLLSMVYLNLHF